MRRRLEVPDDVWRQIAALVGPRPAPRPVWYRQARWLVQQLPLDLPVDDALVRRVRAGFRRWRERQRLARRCRCGPARVRYAVLRPPPAATTVVDLLGGRRRPPTEPRPGWSLGTYNLGGPRISVARFRAVLATLVGLGAHCWGLTEFRPTEGPLRYQGLAAAHGLTLLWSAERPRHGGGGLAVLLRRECLDPDAPVAVLEELVRGHLALVPRVVTAAGPVALAVFYAPHQRGHGVQSHLEAQLDALLAAHARLILMGDMNATTRLGDTHRPSRPPRVRPPWRWLRDREDDGSLVDVVRPTQGDRPLHTRVRLYSGTRSYLDRVYLSRALWEAVAGGPPCEARIVDVSAVPGASDHDPVVVRLPDDP